MRAAYRTLWLSFVVFILYQDLCTTALSNLKSKRTNKDSSECVNRRSDGTSIKDCNMTCKRDVANINADVDANNEEFIENLRMSSYHGEICAEWQHFDGEKCVCADRCDKDDDIVSGKVCDIHGKEYADLCIFSQTMCSHQISVSTEMASCGLCTKLRLTGSSVLPEDPDVGLGIFIKDTSGNTWTALDDNGNKIRLFTYSKTKSWAIGSTDERNAAIMFDQYTRYPQDMEKGGYVLINDSYTEQDPFLHFECIEREGAPRRAIVRKSSDAITRRPKRFIFFLVMASVAVVSTVASYTVTKVQEKNGCLFYPSVCDLKKEVNEELKPEVLSLQAEYTSILGDPEDIKDLAMSVFTQLLDMKEHMIELKKLDDDFRDLSEKIGPDLEFLNPDLTKEFDTIMHDDWIKGLAKQNTWTLLGFVYVQMPMEMYSLITATASKVSMAFAAVGAALAVITAVVSIVVSALNEKKQRDELIAVKRDLLEARTSLKLSISHAKSFQKQFYEAVVLPLKNLAKEMRNYSKHFNNLYLYLTCTYGSSLTDSSPSVTSNVKRDSMLTLKDKYLFPINYYLAHKLHCLKSKMEEYDNVEKLITTVHDGIKNHMFPDDIYHLVHSVDEQIAQKLVPTQFSLLQFIEEKVSEDSDCYWGYSLANIRSGSVIESNYRSQPLCDSPELNNIKKQFENLIKLNTSPSRFTDLITDDIFTNKYQRIKFMADFVLPNEKCYWGYNLDLIRKNMISESEISNAILDKYRFEMLKSFNDDQLSESVCKLTLICNSDWRKYTECLIKGFDNGDDLCIGSSSCA